MSQGHFSFLTDTDDINLGPSSASVDYLNLCIEAVDQLSNLDEPPPNDFSRIPIFPANSGDVAI